MAIYLTWLLPAEISTKGLNSLSVFQCFVELILSLTDSCATILPTTHLAALSRYCQPPRICLGRHWQYRRAQNYSIIRSYQRRWGGTLRITCLYLVLPLLTLVLDIRETMRGSIAPRTRSKQGKNLDPRSGMPSVIVEEWNTRSGKRSLWP
jgi:hypothetical protein